MDTILDPQSVYFKSRVISRDDSREEKRKNLYMVVGEDARNTIIIDDTQSVCKQNGENLISINRYSYFTFITDTHKLKKEDQESFIDEDGSLKSILEVFKCVHKSFFQYFPKTYVEQDYKTVDVIHVFKKVRENYF
ncbi:hypothetical protein MKX01_002868 [Papaver californicum]|nr:hypothetical protein MKX01_002868 [Papaver californicum]